MSAYIKIAVSWWANFLKNEFTWNNGDEYQSAFADSLLASAGKPSIEQIIEFEVALFDLVESNIKSFNFSAWPYFKISVDYYPNKILTEACNKAGIEINHLTFPCKTAMEIYQDKILVKQGYGGVYEELKQPHEASGE